MRNVLHAKSDGFRSRPLGGIAAALALGLSVACALAGEAGASFRITVNLAPETVEACSANTNTGAPQVTCRPSVVGVTTSSDAGASRDPTVLRYRTEPGLRLAGEMIEVGNENYFAWADRDNVAVGEYSSRVVAAGGREYVEMTVTW